MKTPKTYSAIPNGFNAELVTIEGDITKGLSYFNIVGMPDKTVEESRERIRAAIRNSGMAFPTDKVTINLAPAELQKRGSYLDLPIAVNILALTGQLNASDLQDSIFVGELALDGKIRPLRGIINVAELATKRHFKRIYLPAQNATQAQLVATKNLRIFPVTSLKELWLMLKEIAQPQPIKTVVKNTQTDSANVYLDQIIGQEVAKRALVIAVAGHHNLLLSGPPGAGKSLLASVAPNLLPPLNKQESIEATKLHSLVADLTDIIHDRPFRAPHHSASATAIIGNGLPGEISLAHTGVLYLDEIPEFRRDLLESLRQPLENKRITITRAKGRQSYPADFMLIATMNPCPCGYYGSKDHACKCTITQIHNYQHKLSGPLLDRIDMTVKVDKVANSVLVKNTTFSTQEHASAKQQIERALSTQFKRQHKYNANLSSYEISQQCQLTPAARSRLEAISKKHSLSARSYFKLIKVAQTIADLAESTQILPKHVSEAAQFRDEI